ncbi:Gfo/Idh/MocA family oxidoreductase [Microbacterium sp. ET2]|uniref:Gfo/Idh/MocA family protein n=1 Tax=Microbacterium albipurpureum TaxID=3050384 RepID=UPI00259CE2FF|nr:Gfo/Idh/MocA family oxidoreductase [Microbacterium sp. ET2 (Ac-2212)]WJL96766.1 Gfo/Idh/MocA family oxidoreductase [Microbacterium sp. ET2 (Ac-2212)]
MQDRVVGVGIVGSGSVVQGIHLPTLSRLADRIEVRHVMDVDLASAQKVAARIGARASASVDDLLTDPTIEVVAVCSPHRFHAEQVIAACRAGVPVVLCEKPFATRREEAERIAHAAAASGTRLVVGAMHTYDPGWEFVRERWGDLPETATLIRSSIVLPFNDRFEDWSTEVETPIGLPMRDTSTPEARAAVITARILGLGIHDIPLVRTFLPEWADLEVIAAELLDPLGYAVTLRAGRRVAQLTGSFRDHGVPEWEFEVVGPRAAMHIEFSPSYVHAGSAVATIIRDGERVVFGPHPENGYVREWRHAAALARDPQTPSASVSDLVDDLALAVHIADRAGDFIRRSAASEEGDR